MNEPAYEEVNEGEWRSKADETRWRERMSRRARVRLSQRKILLFPSALAPVQPIRFLLFTAFPPFAHPPPPSPARSMAPSLKITRCFVENVIIFSLNKLFRTIHHWFSITLVPIMFSLLTKVLYCFRIKYSLLIVASSNCRRRRRMRSSTSSSEDLPKREEVMRKVGVRNFRDS